jgi:hypothetical protein
MIKNRYLLGVFFIILSAIGFSTLQMLVKLLPDVSLASKLFFRNIIITMITGFVIKVRGLKFDVEKEDRKLLSLRIVTGTISLAFSFYTLKFITLADSTILQKLSSVIMLVISHYFFDEKFTKYHLMGLITAFFGVVFIIKPVSSSINIGYILAIFSAILTAISYSSIRAIGRRGNLDPMLIVFYFSLISCMVFLPFMLMSIPSITSRHLYLLIAIGIFGSIGQYGITFAYKFASSKEVGVFEYSQVIFSSLLGIVFLNEIPDIYSVIGYLLIVLAGVGIYLYNNKIKEA